MSRLPSAATEAWIVRAGRDDEYAALGLERGIVGLAWHRVGDLTDATTAHVRTVTWLNPGCAAPSWAPRCWPYRRWPRWSG